MNVRFTLVADGATDAALLPILKWAVQCDQRVGQVELSFAEPGMLPPARLGLAERMRRALELYPANLLFVHRDAERETAATRRDETFGALQAAAPHQITVPVVPVRMTEAWLLVDEQAIRFAAGNPRGTVALDLPRLRAIEDVADPKDALHTALRTASERRGRRLQKFNATAAALLVAERIADFAPIRHLSAFKEFEDLLRGALDSIAESSR
jgi:hypothetical protein